MDGSSSRCEHYVLAAKDVEPRTKGCEECEKAGSSDWVALRMCLLCGHVGCCDSSPGMHATRHFKETAHPVMVALPSRSWKWCYVHKEYG